MSTKIIVASLALCLLYTTLTQAMTLSGTGLKPNCQCLETVSTFIHPRFRQNVELNYECESVENQSYNRNTCVCGSLCKMGKKDDPEYIRIEYQERKINTAKKKSLSSKEEDTNAGIIFCLHKNASTRGQAIVLPYYPAFTLFHHGLHAVAELTTENCSFYF